jgi:dTMP kinase
VTGQADARGRLIVFEGGEGSGKSTQLKRLGVELDRLGTPFVALREPGGTPLGADVRHLLLDPGSDIVPRAEALLFMSSRAQLVDRQVVPSLERGHVVLLDRFFLSTYAYQIAGRGLKEADVRAANAFATAGLVPDLTILLTFPVREGLARVTGRDASHDRIEALGEAFHRRVADGFAEFARPEWQAAHPECGPIVAVSAEGTEEDVAARVKSALSRKWPDFFQAVVA